MRAARNDSREVRNGIGTSRLALCPASKSGVFIGQVICPYIWVSTTTFENKENDPLSITSLSVNMIELLPPAIVCACVCVCLRVEGEGRVIDRRKRERGRVVEMEWKEEEGCDACSS